MSYSHDRNAHDVGVSQMVQDDFTTHAGALEAALDRHDSDVMTAMQDYDADGVSDNYLAMEKQYNAAGKEVRDIIKLLKDSLSQGDDVAITALNRAKSYIPN